MNYFVNRSTNASVESFNAKTKNFRVQLRGVICKKLFIYRLVKNFGKIQTVMQVNFIFFNEYVLYLRKIV